jgi:two-component system LytT family response regulator
VRRLRVLVADDEAMARRRLERLVGAMPDLELVASCADGEQALARAAECAPDLLLLDIDMPGVSGLDAGALLPCGGQRPAVVFVTAHPQHALAAFEVGARDYLLKPVDPERLRRTVDRVAETLRAAVGAAGASPPTAASERLAVNTARGVRLVDPGDITHAVFDGTAVVVHTTERRLYASGTLAELERRLAGACFFRVHRRALINLDHVELLEPTDSGGFVARVSGGGQVQISRKAARELRRRLSLWG